MIEQKIKTFLMFEGNAEEAINFYVSLFGNSSILNINRYGPADEGPEGKVMNAVFSLNGQLFMCTDSFIKHDFTFTPAMSLLVTCETVIELEKLYNQLSEGGSIMMPLDKYPFSEKFAWVSDKYGVSWQLTI